MQKIRVLFLIVVLVAGSLLVNRSATAQDPGQTFKTPEDAITYYFQGVAAGDASKILQACAIDEISTNFKLDVTIARIQAFEPLQMMGPTNYPLYMQANKAQITAQILNQVKMFVYSLLSTEDVSSLLPILRPDADRVAKFIKDVDPARLATIEVKKTGMPNKAVMTTTRYQQNATKQALAYGADELTERVVLFSFDGNLYMAGFMLLRYGENWKISSAGSVAANTSSTGVPVKITEAEFDKLVG